MIDNQDFIEKYKHLLTTQKVKGVQDFAEKMGFNRSYVSQILHNRVPFSAKMILKMEAEYPELKNLYINIKENVSNRKNEIPQNYMQNVINLQSKIIELQNEIIALKTKIMLLTEKINEKK